MSDTLRYSRALNAGLMRIQSVGSLSQAQRETLEGMVRLVARMYLESDRENFEFISAESEFEVPGLVRGRVDLLLRVLDSPRSKYLVPYRGKTAIVDWKTSSGALDSRWKNRYSLSWQWRIYSCALGASLFLYRGISTRYLVDSGTYEVKEFGIEVPDWNEAAVHEELRLAYSQMRSYGKGTRWPRVLDHSACHAFGGDCPFLVFCQSGSQGYEGDFPETETLSYSKLNLLHLCPDRMRMTYLAELQNGQDGFDEEFEQRYLGQVVHEAISEMYRVYFLQED